MAIRDTYARQSLGKNLSGLVAKSKVLMVGAGGIGCELLKNLVLMNFGEIHVVDLDTIDLSNLNRQFLFRNEHIKQSKAIVAQKVASRFNPSVVIKAYHGNIKDSQFSKAWFRQFDIVFNALDNMDARRYVNTVCIALDIPLVESGTTGFRGQASVIKKGITPCYDCTERETPKSFPVCTIRSTPSQPIHCIVWAKSYLFTEIFGEGSDDVKELDYEADENDKDELDDIKKETAALQKIRKSIGTDSFAELLFQKVFTSDIETLGSIKERWSKQRPAPQPLDYQGLNADKSKSGAEEASQDQKTWTVKECFAVLQDSIRRLTDRAVSKKESLDFDKDDEDTLDFVAAAANLRSYIFGIDPKSKFDIKQMAGNIIPAIATTNAIIAGACVLQAFKVLSQEYKQAKQLAMFQSTDRMMLSHFEGPNPKCQTCSVLRTSAMIKKEATLQDLVSALQSTLGYEDLSLLANSQVLFETDDEDFEDMLPKTLIELELTSFITVQTDGKEDLVLTIEEASDADMNPVSLTSITIPDKKPEAPLAIEQPNGHTNGQSNGTSHRKRAASGDLPARPAVRVKTNDDAVIIDDEPVAVDDGPIVID
ncbi:hypothetical protein BT63DRAFT_426870 [Microthyrium microscopicum]|uniref:Ubiquitin-activating enzyme E1-like n=1 Tax=Microthyrium microscopicum TaxID=703497 RepID=A0A6A6U785_9PEZI|nr:hypothetical protein BT63DRAFT_426870 [Microthyrium microscopicum]